MRYHFRKRHDPREAQVREALIVLATVAAEDSDHAHAQNGVGFSKSDSSKGHALARLSLGAAMSNEATISDVMRMAARYRRQSSRIMQLNLI